jgi:tetratricopeptide (TPR) repeat protein
MTRTVTLLGLLTLAAAGLTAGLARDTAKPATAPPARRAAPAMEAASAANTAGLASFEPASFRFQEKEGGGREPDSADAPLSLTGSDGAGLALVALEVNGVLEPPLAFTELRMTFDNPRDETIEGRFRITLPPGAALSRFAMKIGDSWQEGEVVEKQRARVAYEDFLHRRQDPALLEQEAGNEFSARVFPIPARGRKELIVSYSHALARADQPYVLPLRGLAEVGRLDIRVLLGDRPAGGVAASNLGGEVTDRRVVELHREGWTPNRDLVVPQDRAASVVALRQGNLAAVRVAAPVQAVPQEIAGLYVLVDSSASRALGYATQVRRVADLLAGLRDGAGGAVPVGVAAFDQEVVAIFEGRADGFGADEVRRLAGRRPLGASDLHAALTWLADRLGESRLATPRVLVVTDGVATAGETETRALKAAVHALGARGVERLDVLAMGGLRDEGVLRELATGNLKQDGQLLDGAAPLAEIARRLTLACRSGVKVAVEGAAWSWPETLDGIQPGDGALVYADVPEGKPLRVTLGGQPVVLPGEPAKVERALLERAWAQARIERLTHLREVAPEGDEDLRRALTLQITEVSIRHRVLSPFTALLVLETEGDYQRFGLDRKALADILTVGPGGLEVLERSRPRAVGTSPVVTPKTVNEPMEDALGSVDVPEAEDLQSLGYLGGEAPDGVPGGVAGGVVGGVEGGVAGGVPGGVPVGVSAAPQIAPPPPPPPAPRVVPAPATEQDRSVEAVAPLRVGGQREERVVSEIPPRPDDDEAELARKAKPWTGRYAEVKADLAAGRLGKARTLAESWSAGSPGDVLALLALGEVWEAAGEKRAAARAYGSLIDLFPGRVDMRRLAGERLERLGEAGLTLAIDTYQKAVEDRPDHPTGHRLLAWALLRAGRFADAFAAMERAIDQQYPDGRFAGLDRVLHEELGLLGAAWLHAEPARHDEVLDRLQRHGAWFEKEPSLRFVLSWETDANDVDLHVRDSRGGHAYFSKPKLASGGELYADVTTGYGPECFTVPDPAGKAAAPYRLAVHYYSRGPMGYGMGILQVIRHDGKGGLTVESRPFVVMADDAMVRLGAVK